MYAVLGGFNESRIDDCGAENARSDGSDAELDRETRSLATAGDGGISISSNGDLLSSSYRDVENRDTLKAFSISWPRYAKSPSDCSASSKRRRRRNNSPVTPPNTRTYPLDSAIVNTSFRGSDHVDSRKGSTTAAARQDIDPRTPSNRRPASSPSPTPPSTPLRKTSTGIIYGERTISVLRLLNTTPTSTISNKRRQQDSIETLALKKARTISAEVEKLEGLQRTKLKSLSF
jgi:hypothetical protein